MNTISKEKRETFNYRKSKLYQKYSKHCNDWVYGSRAYAYDREAQSDMNKFARHLASKSLRRGLEKEAKQIINEEIQSKGYRKLIAERVTDILVGKGIIDEAI